MPTILGTGDMPEMMSKGMASPKMSNAQAGQPPRQTDQTVKATYPGGMGEAPQSGPMPANETHRMGPNTGKGG